MTGEASANSFAVIARSVSDPRVKPEGRRGNLPESAPIKVVAASLTLPAMTNEGNDNLKRAAAPGRLLKPASPGAGRASYASILYRLFQINTLRPAGA
jgi:hypothetical protein